MSQHGSHRAYHLTLFRQGADALAAGRAVVHASPMPLTAPSEWRVSGAVRQLAAALEEQFPSLESIEALCRFAGGESLAPIPGLLLFDRRSPIWMALFDDMVFMSISAELLDGNPRARFTAAQRYFDALRAAGFANLIDHQSDRTDFDGRSVTDITARLAAAGHSRWFGRLVRDARFGLVMGTIVFLDATAIIGSWPGRTRPPQWIDFVEAVLFGGLMACLQYWASRRRLNQHLRQMRAEIVADSTRTTRLVFRESSVYVVIEAIAGLVFGGMAAASAGSGSWFGVMFFGALGVISLVSLVSGWRRTVVLEDDAITTDAPVGRTRIAYADVLRIVPWPRLGTTLVSSEGGWLQIPFSFDERGQLVSLLWDRVQGALDQQPLQVPPTDAELLQQLRDALEASRRKGMRLRDAACPPLWMLSRRWNHPLLRQYSYQRRLLREGHLVMARVLTAHRILLRVPRAGARFDAPAIVMYALDSSDRPVSLDELDRVAGRLNDGSDPDAAESFWKAVDASGEFPVLLPIPEPFAEGLQVYCTSVMIARRHIPLGYLRAGWLPLLVAPPERYSMVLPMRFWGPSVRSAWKRGEDAAPAKTYAA